MEGAVAVFVCLVEVLRCFAGPENLHVCCFVIVLQHIAFRLLIWCNVVNKLQATYMQRDQQEVRDIIRRICHPETQSLYIQMVVGRRSKCLRPSAVEAASAGPIANATSRCLDNWRRMRVWNVLLQPESS